MSENISDPAPPPAADALNEPVGLAPADAYDPVLEVFRKDVDRTLLRENLKLTVDQRAHKMLAAIKAADQVRGLAGRPKK